MTETLSTHSTTIDAWGVARKENGEIVFVQRTLPDEQVSHYATNPKGAIKRVFPAQVEASNAQRCKPDCTIYDSCGQCCWLHTTAAYENQLKATELQNQIQRMAGTTLPDPQPANILPRNQSRTRTALNIKSDGSLYWIGPETESATNRQHVALAKILESQCLVLHPTLLTALTQLEQEKDNLRHWYKRVKQNQKKQSRRGLGGQQTTSPVLQIATDGSQNWSVALREKSAAAALKSMKNKPEWLAAGALRNPIDWYGSTIYNDPRYFFQPSIDGLRLMSETLRNWTNPDTEYPVCWDLFGGQGALGISLHDRVGQIRVLDTTLPVNGTAGNQYLSANLYKSDGLQDLQQIGDKDLVLADPPRGGLKEPLCDALSASSCQRFYYASCHHATFARDLKYLLKAGWSVHRWKLVHQFPGAGHVEIVAEIQRQITV